MLKWINKGIPLPFGAISNGRSLVALDNLVSFIISTVECPRAVSEIFLISDCEDVSPADLLQKLIKALGKRAWFIPISVNLMCFSARLIGKSNTTNRLFSSLQVDSSKAKILLVWEPVITMDEQLKKLLKRISNNEKVL